MNKSLKRLVFIGIIVVLIIISIIIALLKIKKNVQPSSSVQNIEIEQADKDEILDYTFYKVTDITEYIAVENSINSYYSKNKDSKYKNFFIDELYFSIDIYNNNGEKYGKYYIYGTLWNDNYNTNEHVLFEMNLELETDIFEITALDISTLEGQSFEQWVLKKQSEYVKDYKTKYSSKSNSEETAKETTETEQNNTSAEDDVADEIILEEIDANTIIPDNDTEDKLAEEVENIASNYLYSNFDENTICERIIKKNIVNALFNNEMENTYNLLTEDCKSTYFKNLNDFADFVNKFKEAFLNLKVTNAEIQETEEAQEYGDIFKFSSGSSINFTIYSNNINDYKISISK